MNTNVCAGRLVNDDVDSYVDDGDALDNSHCHILVTFYAAFLSIKFKDLSPNMIKIDIKKKLFARNWVNRVISTSFTKFKQNS